jgi:hypothetical protein
MLQEQMVNLSNSLQNSLQKMSDDIAQVSHRVDQLEQNQRGPLDGKLSEIIARLELLPKLYNNQVSTLETLLVGHQYQFKRLASIVSRDQEFLPDGFPNGPVHGQDNDANDGVAVQTQLSGPSQVLNHVSSSSNNVPSQQVPQQVQQVPQQVPQQQQQRLPSQGSQVALNRMVSQSRVPQNSVNLSMISSQAQAQAQAQAASRNNVSRQFNIMSSLENDQIIPHLQRQPTPNDDALNSLNEVVEDDARRMWENVQFRRLNPHPKDVREVLDEFYYGHEGQPPLKYLEKHRKDWRKGNKNLSKTFCRRYRIVVAVENGVRHYVREFGLSESVARERIVNELESLRIKENGKKETMYWLFHHIPQNLKRR